MTSQDGRSGRSGYIPTTLTDGTSAALRPSVIDNAFPGVGEYVIGTFTATGTTEVIDITAGSVPQINAFEVRDITAAAPEPTSVALIGLGALVLLFVNRRRTA